jgi:putative ABC transport system permease protein
MPDWKQEILTRLAGLKLAPAREAEIVEELSQHLEDRFRELVSGGAAEDAARRMALEELRGDNVAPPFRAARAGLKEDAGLKPGATTVEGDANTLASGLRRVEQRVNPEPAVMGSGGKNFFASFRQDLRYAVRMLRKSPGFTAVAVITLALGIGANAVIFNSVNAMLLRPFLVRDLDRVVAVWEAAPKQNLDRASVAPGNFFDWNSQNKSFEQLAAMHGWGINLTGSGVAERVEGFQVTRDFFTLLGIAAEQGRTVAAGDFEPGHSSVMVLSHGFWQRNLGADPHVIGRSLLVNGAKFTVIGVMPADFDFPVGAQAWAPLDLTSKEKAERANHYLHVIGRLKKGVSASLAQADLNSIAVRLAHEYPSTNAGHEVQVFGLVEDVAQGSRQFLSVLMGAAIFVLLLACANVANLYLARATSRGKEIALRLALGATRWHIARQLLTESVLAGALAGAVGLLFAHWGLAVSRRSLPPFIVQHVAGLKHLEIDWRVTVFALLVALAAGILAGLAPALRASRPDLQAALKEGTRGSSSAPGHNRLRALFVVTEIVLATVLLAGAGLMVKGFRALMNADPGYDRTHVLTFRTSLSGSRYKEPPRIREFYQDSAARLAALPGVQSVGAVTSLPSSWSWDSTPYRGAGQPPANPGEMRITISQIASPGLFRALKVPLVAGRYFDSQDGADAPPVAVISNSLAERIWPHQEAVGKTIRFGAEEGHEPWRRIVGVVGDIRQSTFDPEPRPTAYVPFEQIPVTSFSFAMRVEGDPLALAPAARDAVRSVDPNEPIYDVRTLEQLISDNLSGVQQAAYMMSAFGFVALVLAAAGIFALMAFFVSQRTHEIGVRMALGAERADVLRFVVGRALKLAAIGLAIGLPFAIGVAIAVSSFLFGMIRVDVLGFVVLTLVLGLVAALAAYIPARRATRVDPMVALRYE